MIIFDFLNLPAQQIRRKQIIFKFGYNYKKIIKLQYQHNRSDKNKLIIVVVSISPEFHRIFFFKIKITKKLTIVFFLLPPFAFSMHVFRMKQLKRHKHIDVFVKLLK